MRTNGAGRHVFVQLSAAALLAVAFFSGCAKQPVTTEEAVVETAPPSAAGMIAEAKLLAAEKDLAGAAAALEAALASERDNLEALRLLASVYSTMGRREESAAVWERISLIDPTDPDAAYEVGSALARAGDWEALRSRMLAAETYGAADSRHYLLLGEADYELGYRGEAERYLKRAGALERACYLLGVLFYNRGDLESAERAFADVIDRNPDNYSAHLHLGWINYSRGALGPALHHYRRAVACAPAEPLARLSLAALLEETNIRAEAIAQYREALTLKGIPRDERKKAYHSLSRLLVDGGRLDEARAVIDQGLGEFPDSGGLYYQWGEALLKSGRPQEAREKFKRAAADPLWREAALRRLHSIR